MKAGGYFERVVIGRSWLMRSQFVGMVMPTIRNPLEWGTDQLRHAASHVASSGRSVSGARQSQGAQILSIDMADLKDALMKGLDDFRACRTDVVFLCIIYPIVGLVLARFAFDYDMLPLLFPAASGFALLGPVAAVGLYEMSRRREQGLDARWSHAFDIVRSPAFIPILLLGLLLLVLFLVWLAVAQAIYMMTLGPTPPVSAGLFIRDVLTTSSGWLMISIGMGVGFAFALSVLAISVVSFPLLLDREVGLGSAVATSMRVFAENPLPIAAWGVIVAGGLAIGSIPAFLGLVFVMPVLGHATWHLYRKTVA
ncbi:MAG: DUF2189 domain-containing protein [Geminicoccaceae bacterium]